MHKPLGLLLALCTTICCCTGPRPDGGDDDTIVYNIVTYQGTSEGGAQSTFTYQEIDDSPLITLAGVWAPASGVSPGQRLLLGYVTDHYGQSGPITVKSAQRTVGGDIAVSPDVPTLSGESVSLVSAWRSGPYLNMHLQANVTSEPVAVSLTLDSLSIHTGAPRLYLTLHQKHNQPDYAMRTAYCSWDIGSIWTPDATRCITIVFKGGEYTIHKNIKDNLKPQS